jgi:cell division protease FtsH
MLKPVETPVSDKVVFMRLEKKFEKLDILETTITEYPTVDKYVLMLDSLSTDRLNLELTKDQSKFFKKEILFPKIGKHKISIKKATFRDQIPELLAPVRNLMNWFVDNFLIIISTLASVMIAFFFLGTRKGEESSDVIKPESIQGSMDNLIGMDEVKHAIDEISLMVENISLFKEHGINKPFNIMFSGPPGTGKTKLAGYLAKKLNMPIIFTSVGSLENKYVGVGANKLEALHKKALEQKRCIIFLDEAENLFKKRGSFNAHKHEDDSTQAFLSLLDGVSTNEDATIIWIVASNFNSMNLEMDEAVLRRFQHKIDFRLPNKQERKAILAHYLTQIQDKHKASNINLDYIAEITSNLSPAILQTIIHKASVMTIHQSAKGNENAQIDTACLYKSFEVTTIGITNKQTTANLQDERKTIATHELGHFIIAFDHWKKSTSSLDEAKSKINVLKISTESISKANALGYVLSKATEEHLSNRSELELKVKELYGGVAAEQVFLGKDKITTGSSNDIDKATKLLKTMVVDLSMYSDSKLNYSLMQNSLDKDSQKELLNNVKEKSKELFDDSILIVAEHKPLIEHILPVLLEKYVLTLDEIFDVIHGFYDNRK